MTKSKLRIGLMGSGFMGKAHAFGYAIAARVFDLPFELFAGARTARRSAAAPISAAFQSRCVLRR